MVFSVNACICIIGIAGLQKYTRRDAQQRCPNG